MIPPMNELQIELAGNCNVNCTYCTWKIREVGKNLMRRELALRLVEEAAGLGLHNVYYHGVGESLQNPVLPEVIARGEQLGLPHALSTNALLLEGDLAAVLRRFPGLLLILSVHLVLPEKIRRRIIDNVTNYLTIPSANREIVLQTVCHEDAHPHYRDFVNCFLPILDTSPNRVRMFFKQPCTFPLDKPQKGYVETELAGHHKISIETTQTPFSIGKHCDLPDRFLLVLADGTFAPCCVGHEDWGIGNASQMSIAEAWGSPRMAEIRRLWRQKDDSILCGKCKKRTDVAQD